MLVSGIDLIEVERIESIIARYGERFLGRVFTLGERSYCRGRPHQLAARFAAKEAVSKAMQTGWSGMFRWKDVEVVNEPSGAPKILLYNAVARSLEKSRIHLSLSHTENTVVALAVIESAKDQ